jgi:hypothetical protein
MPLCLLLTQSNVPIENLALIVSINDEIAEAAVGGAGDFRYC